MMSTFAEQGASAPPAHHHARTQQTHKRRATLEYPNGDLLALSDLNSWYYPMHGHSSDDEELTVALPEGNWGHKNARGGRWVRRGKITGWGPEMEDWEADERARKRIKLLLPQEKRSPSPPVLAHLARSPSPPLISPYPPPAAQHSSYTAFVMDKSVTHTFRSGLVDELEGATNGLVEGEGRLRRALGRLWQVLGEDPEKRRREREKGDGDGTEGGVVPKREDEDEDEGEDEASRVGRAPDLTPIPHKIFLMPYAPVAPANGNGNAEHAPQQQFAVPERQLNVLEKSLAILRELQDDGREYVERLGEIREGLGDVKAQRDVIWGVVRERAVGELQESAVSLRDV